MAWRKKLAVLAGVIFALALALSAMAFYVLRASVFVPPPGKLVLPGLGAPCTVRFDAAGVPHVEAQSWRDAFFSQGYLHARERFFQMELARRAARGRLAELLGVGAVSLDIRMRRWGLAEAALRQRALLSLEAERALAAYAAGVNAALGSLPPWRLAPECLFVPCKPEPWRIEDTLGVGLLLQFNLTWAAGEELQRFRVLAALGKERAAALWGWSAEETAAWIPPEPPGQVQRSLEPPLPVFSGVGSNNWALAAKRSETGAPLLANDPHVGVANPATWYEVHLVTPDFGVAGVSVPGAPGILIGHNQEVAWGITMAMLDDQDLFWLLLDPSGTKERFGDAWLPLAVQKEALPVRGEKPRELILKRSVHGPVVREENGEVFALAWTALQARSPVECFLALQRSRDVHQAMAAFEPCEAPALNLLVADRQGHIGWRITGKVPRRGRGAGKLPAPGHDPSWAWQGLGPWEPPLEKLDPPEGFLATANHDPFAEGDFPPPGFSGEFAAPHRVRTIRKALAARPSWNVQACSELQQEVGNPQALELLAALRPILERLRWPAAEALLAWDGRMDAESHEALLWAEFLRALVRRVGGDEAGQVGLDRSPFTAEALRRLALGLLPAAWWDDVSTSEVEGPEVIVAAALEEASRRAAGKRWGQAHQVLFPHPLGSVRLLAAFFNVGPFPVGGAGPCVNATAYRAQGEDFAVVSLPSMRFVADLADWNRSRLVLPLGQAGHPLATHARDQVEAWLSGGSHPMPFTPEAVAEAAVRTTVFVPR